MLGPPIAVYYQLVATEYGSFRSSSCHSTDGNAVASTCIFYDVAQGTFCAESTLLALDASDFPAIGIAG